MFDRAALDAVTLGLHFDLHGVPATVTRPAPDDTPIETRVIWIPDFVPDIPITARQTRREPMRVMALRRDEVPQVPQKTRVVAALLAGGPDRTWRVDGPVSEDTKGSAFPGSDAQHHRVLVVPIDTDR